MADGNRDSQIPPGFFVDGFGVPQIAIQLSISRGTEISANSASVEISYVWPATISSYRHCQPPMQERLPFASIAKVSACRPVLGEAFGWGDQGSTACVVIDGAEAAPRKIEENIALPAVAVEASRNCRRESATPDPAAC